MFKIGITGQAGFIGTHLYNTLGLHPEEFQRVPFNKSYFLNQQHLEQFVSQCDIIVHLAAVNRHSDPQFIFDTNIGLAEKLVNALESTKSKSHLVFSSSTQEERDNEYGKSKKAARELLYNWSKQSGGKFIGLIIPNVFGPFALPNYNSFIATFCYKLTHGELPEVQQDSGVNLIYVGELVQEIINKIKMGISEEIYPIPHTSSYRVTEVLTRLNSYKTQYLENGEIPELITDFEYQLFNTFRSYIDIKNHFPVKFNQHTDSRGSFVELIRLGIGGQCSFSTTAPGITRGNHYHTRKIERFAVIKGKALIQLRKIDSDEVFDFYLDGSEPAYVDMPVWYTHNIKNIGDDELYTVFWINEPYSPENPDTYFVEV